MTAARRPPLWRKAPGLARPCAVLLGLLAVLGATAPAARAADSVIVARSRSPEQVPFADPAGALSRRPGRPLTLEEDARLRTARAHRLAGRLREAREALAPLLVEAPHHPSVVTERVRLLLVEQDLAGAVRLARVERAAQRDSLLAAREAALALEQLGRPREAAEVALEAWVASPVVADWARGALLRLAGSDARGVRALARRAAQARPDRADLALACALLDWRAGDLRGALAALEDAERPGGATCVLRRAFAEEVLGMEPRDSAAAVAALSALAGDARCAASPRLRAAERIWQLEGERGRRAEAAPELTRALGDVPADDWPVRLLSDLARVLREGGRTAEVRRLLASGRAAPPLELEAALADLRDGPPERALPRLAALAPALPAAAWHHAEAWFFAGRGDSALALYQEIVRDPGGPFGGAALERIYLIEDAGPGHALAAFGRIAYEEWRGARGTAMALTDSLARSLPRGPLWARAALLLAGQRAAAGDAAGALAPLLAVADSLPDDRLAPLARQRAGDLYLERFRDARAALAQYEECLARYPRAWNAPEVRRAVERLRREARP